MKKEIKTDKEDHSILILFGTIFLIILISVAFGMFIRNSTKPKIVTEYSNGFTFTKHGNFWYTTIRNPVLKQDYEVDFRYSPSQVQNVSVSGDPRKFFKLLQANNLSGAYFTFNPNDNLTYMSVAAADIAKFLKVINGVTLVPGCTVNETVACNKRPIVTCENQLDKAMVIYVKASEVPQISLQKNCLTVEGMGDGLVKAYTKLLFLWYNIL